MDENDIVAGAQALEDLAVTNICYKNFSTHLSENLRNHHFRSMFCVSSCTMYLLWTTNVVDVAGPVGGKCIHLLWMLMFLKEYCDQDIISSVKEV